MKPKVIYVFGASYCGSSILNLLLDTQRGVSGMGEAWRIYGEDRKQSCYVCGDKPCSLYKEWKESGLGFYEYARRVNGGDILVDTSKNPGRAQLLDNVKVIPVVLSKTPIGIAASNIGHGYSKPVKNAIRTFANLYTEVFSAYPNALAVTYRDLATRPKEAIARIGREAGFEAGPIDGWDWSRERHIQGGNVAARRQALSETDAEFMEKQLPKYEGKRGRLYYDESGERDEKLVAEVREAVKKSGLPFAWLLGRLGHSSKDCERIGV